MTARDRGPTRVSIAFTQRCATAFSFQYSSMAAAGISSEEHDEYDQFYDPIDVEALPYIASLPPSPSRPSRPGSATHSQSRIDKTPVPDSPHKPADSSDEYDGYDFSELTTDDFANIDATVRSAFEFIPDKSSEINNKAKSSADVLKNNANELGGPAVDIRVEELPTDSSGVVKEAHPPPAFEESKPKSRAKQASSPYDRFRSWKGFLGVTDLVGPSW